MRPVDYDAIAADFDRRYLVNDYSGVQQALLAFVGTSGTRALEVGCGTGHWLRVLGDAGVRAAGVDLSARMLHHARRKAGGARLAQARAERLPFVDGEFDRVYCVNALHHFDDGRGFVTEARRVLAPGGQLLTIGLDPHEGIDRWYLYEYFEPVLAIDRRRYRPTRDIRDWLRDAGFVDVHTRVVQHLPATLDARVALESHRLAKHVTSQLAVLTDEQYDEGIRRIRTALADAEARGAALPLTADLRLYGTTATVPR